MNLGAAHVWPWPVTRSHLGRTNNGPSGGLGGFQHTAMRERPGVRLLTGRALPGFDSLTVWAGAGPSHQELQKCLTHIFLSLGGFAPSQGEGLLALSTPAGSPIHCLSAALLCIPPLTPPTTLASHTHPRPRSLRLAGVGRA